MAQINILLHTKLGSRILTFPMLNTSLYVNSSPKHHFGYPIIQAIKTSSLILEDKSSSTSKIPYWTSITSEIEAHLTQAMPIREPLNVFEPMHHLTFDGPRSMAPALCVATCDVFGGNRAQALQVAAALHVMHAAVRAHDNLPLINSPRPNTRSDRPIDHVYSSGIELQTGDGLFSFGYELLAGLNHSHGYTESGRVLRVIIEVSRTMGGQGVVEGQFREVECCQIEGDNKVCEEGWLRHIYEKKSGGLYACGAACGAILGGASDQEIEKLKKFGLYVGTIQGLLHEYGNKDEEINDEEFVGKYLVVASGEASDPFCPQIEGLSSFQGKTIHSTQYKSGKEYNDKNVLVVGSGNSGIEIALDLANYGAKTSIVVRSPVHILSREMVSMALFLFKYLPNYWVDYLMVMLSKIVYGDITKYGLTRPKEGPFYLKVAFGKYPIIDVGTFSKIKSGEIQILPAITSIKGNDVVFQNGKFYTFDSIIFATGFKRSSSQWLQGDKYLLNEDGMSKQNFPNHWKGKNGLYCVGLARRGLYGAAMDAENISQDIKKYLENI